MIEQLQTDSPNIVAFKLSGKLHDEDYKQFVPIVDAAIAKTGKVRLLARFVEFQGWDMQAAWDDFKFGVRHYADFERIAMVGDQDWQEWMARFCRPFTKAEVRYFGEAEQDDAWAWIGEGA